ncbi:MAG: aspartate 1-decarboxylase [Actinomycetota bacterium]
MNITILKSKIHRAKVTDAKIHYMGSITIDRELMDRAGIVPYEQVLIVSLDSGERLTTYVIEGQKGSREICSNGAAARKILEGDRIIVMSFASVDQKQASEFKPKVITLDQNNQIIDEEYQLDENDQC